MEKDSKFPEQEAPVKNTDHAFVKVAQDGSPEIPKVEQPDNKNREEEKPEETSRH